MPTINMLSVEARGVDLKTNPLLLGASRSRMAVNMVFDEGSIRTRPGFRYHRTRLFGQFQGASEFRPTRGISAGVFSEEPPQLVITAGGLLGTVTLGTSDVVCDPKLVHPSPLFMCLGDVNIYQAENYAVIQNVETSTYWFDGKALTESPGMVDQDWNDPDYFWDDVESVTPESDIQECENSSEEYLNKVVIRVTNSLSSEPIPDALVELVYNRQVAYSGFTNESGVFETFVYPRTYQVMAYADGYENNTSEDNKVEATAKGAYVTEGCEQVYRGLDIPQHLDIMLKAGGTTGWIVSVLYRGSEGPCLGGHVCDAAVFDVFLNNVIIGKANLNNFDDAGDREAIFTIDFETAQSIGTSRDGLYVMSFACDPTFPGFDLTAWEGGCHPGIGWVIVEDDEGNTLYSGCPDEGDFLEIDSNPAP